MSSAAARRREVDRAILERMSIVNGSGWLTAEDVTARLFEVSARVKLEPVDGRRVAGKLRSLRRRGLVDARPLERGDLLEYSVTRAGLAWLILVQRDEPRLTDPPPRSWPRGPRVAHRHRGGRP